MQKVYYKRMRKAALPASAVALLFYPCAAFAQQPRSSVRGSVLDAHEGMTVTAEPWTSPEQYKQSFHKKSPFASGIIAIRVSFRNDTNQSIRIGLSRIRLTLNIDENDRQELQPLSAADVADTVYHAGDPSSSRARFPLPVPLPKSSHDKKWNELKQAAEDAGVRAGVIAPHTTAEGLLYFDLRGQFDLLNTAHLYIPDLVALETNHALLYFELDLSRSGGS